MQSYSQASVAERVSCRCVVLVAGKSVGECDPGDLVDGGLESLRYRVDCWQLPSRSMIDERLDRHVQAVLQ